MIGFLIEWAEAFWGVLVEAGWWLVIGFLVGGIIHAFLPGGFIRRALGGRGFGSVLKASLVGIPLPLCSCSVIPTVAALRRQGASRGASAAFAIATPEVDVPSASLTWGLMGPAMAIARPIGALATALTAGTLVDRFAGGEPAAKPEAQGLEPKAGCCSVSKPAPAKASSCCGGTGGGCGGGSASGESVQMTVGEPVEPVSDCCATVELASEPEGATHGGVVSRVGTALRHAFVEMPADLVFWLTIGLAIAALLGVAVPADAFEGALLGGPLGMVLALVISVPFYVCAVASTPLAAVFIAKGLSPAAALVFLLAGPATNTTTMAWVLKDLGVRALVIYIASISAVALLAGVAFQALGLEVILAGAVHAHEHGADPVGGIGAAALGLLLLVGATVKIRRRLARRRRTAGAAAPSCCSTAAPAGRTKAAATS